MADSPKGNQGKELSMEMRLLLAFILMGAVLFLWPYLYQQPETQPRPAPAEVEQPVATPQPGLVPPTPAQQEPVPATPPVEGEIAAQEAQQYTIETDLYKIVFSNHGAVVHSWVLKQYMDINEEPLELVNPAAAVKVGYPFAFEFKENPPATDPNNALFAVTETNEGLGLDFEFSDGEIYYKKSFRFERDHYLSDFSSEIIQDGRAVPHLVVWRGGFGDTSVPNAYSTQHSLFYDLAQRELVVNDSDEAEDGPIYHIGNYSFAGLEDAYFAAVAVPRNGSSFEMRTFSDLLVPRADGEAEQPHVGAAVGGEGRNEFPLFVGPKDLDLLKEVDPRLQQIVDFGFFSILARPLFIGLKWLHDQWVPNYGWSIVLITVAINFLLLPLKFTSLKSMRKMQALQPLVKQINEKYKGVGIRDPKKSQQNEEMMALYKKHGVNPMGGCLPMVLQIPFFFAFYTVLTVAIELRGADWLWVRDLSQPEHLPIRVLPLVMVASQFAMQKMTPTTASIDPNQQRMMMLMPLMFGFFFYGVSSGLVLYWLTSNVVGVGQQLLFNKLMPADAPVEVKPETKSKKRRPGKKR